MDKVREQGFDRNTVVLFTSDNGSMEGAHRLVGKWNKDTNPVQEELFDLSSDPHEEHNLVNDSKCAETLAALRTRCDTRPDPG
jgi:arylsulfatase A-like enzyme